MQVGGISRPKAAAAAEQRRHFLGVAEVATLDVAFKAACHDGERVYGADRQGTMRTLSCADGTVKGFSKCTAVPHCIACVGGREVWVGCADGDLHVFSADTAEVIKRWRAHNGGVTCIGVGVDAVYTGGADFKLRKWSYQGEQLAARGHHHGLVQGMLVLDPPPAVTATSVFSTPPPARSLTNSNPPRSPNPASKSPTPVTLRASMKGISKSKP